MSTLPGILTAGTLLAIGLLHARWALDKPMATAAAIPSVGGRPSFKPSAKATLAVAIALIIAARWPPNRAHCLVFCPRGRRCGSAGY